MLGGFIALVVLAGVMFGAGRGFALILAHDYTPDDPLVKNVRRYTALAAALMMGGAALLTLFASVHRVEAGHAGLVRRFGAVTGRHVEPGLNMTWPFAEDLVIYDTRVQKVPFENIEAASQEYQSVKVTGVLNYRINPAAVPWLFENVGGQDELEDKVLVPALAQNMKAIMPTYPIFGILPARELIADQVEAAMTQTFATYVTDDGVPVVFFAPRALRQAGQDTDAVSLVNLDFSDEFDKSVEEKQVQENQIQIEQNILKQRDLQRQQRITEAQGEAEANRLIAESLKQGPEALQFKAIEKLADDVRLIILPEGSPLIPLLGPELLGQ